MITLWLIYFICTMCMYLRIVYRYMETYMLVIKFASSKVKF